MLGELSSDIHKQVEKGIAILKEGGLVAFPTDTVYGLGACVSLPQAVERVYKVKGRPLNMPFPWLVSDESQIAEAAETVPSVAWLLIRRFLPGALTLVLPKSSVASTTIAVRIPAHPIPIALIKGLGTPIVGTSANLSGKQSPLTADEVRSQLGDKVDFIIDGGRCIGGIESTVVDVTGETPVILREGAISREEIERVCGTLTSRKETE